MKLTGIWMKNRHHDMNIGKIGIILESFSNFFHHQEEAPEGYWEYRVLWWMTNSRIKSPLSFVIFLIYWAQLAGFFG